MGDAAMADRREGDDPGEGSDRRAGAQQEGPQQEGKVTLLDAELQAAGFGRMRQDHKKEIAEDYVELVADLIDAKGEARAVDLAGRLGVTSATVNNTVAKLQRMGLLETEPYRAIFLTGRGRALAQACRRRHQIVHDFLKALGVSDATAARDTEGIEHHVSAETLEALEHLLTHGLPPADER